MQNLRNNYTLVHFVLRLVTEQTSNLRNFYHFRTLNGEHETQHDSLSQNINIIHIKLTFRF